MARLGDVVAIDRVSVQPEQIPSDSTYLGLEDIEPGGRIIQRPVINAGDLKSAKFRFDERHILFGKLRPNLAKVARPGFSGICSTDLLPLLPSSVIDRDFLSHFLLAPATVAWSSSRTAGVNLPRLSPAVLEDLEIPLPPLPEQRRIAAILDQADELRAKRRRALEIVDDFADSLYAESFEKRNWRRTTLAEVLSGIDSGLSPVCRDQPAREGEWGVLKLSAVTSGVYDPYANKAIVEDFTPTERLEVRPGDVLLTRKNTLALVGASAFVFATPKKRLLPDLVFRLLPDQSSGIDPLFLQRQLARPAARLALSKLASGSAVSMANISKERLNGLEIDLPPIEAQVAFSDIYRELIETQQKALTSLRVLDELFASLQQRAFSGEL
jgi:type I restriction enzyme S subunit